MKNLLPGLSIAGLTLVLAACTPHQPPTITPLTTLHGQIQGQDALTGGGAASVLLRPLPVPGGSSAPLATAQVAADGTFTLSLPTAADVDVEPYLQPVPSFSNPSCSGQIDVTPPTTRQTGFSTLFLSTDGTMQVPLGSIKRTSTQKSDGSTLSVDTVNLWVYVDVPARMAGTQTCEGSITTQVDLTLQKGWNAMTSVDTSVVFPDGHVTRTSKLSRGTETTTVWTSDTIEAY
ncbi:hypothetical protein [Deinococcus sonorensis]|uniref:Lipoprotein n=2 Tax=Deinococcus sonorensis TaxID=309891 RepID=A0AAU7U875_9DEIO